MSTVKPLPSPPAQPILGHMREFSSDILGFLRRLAQDYDEIVQLKLAHLNICYLFDPALIREVFVKRASEFQKSDLNQHIFSKILGNGLVVSEGDFHRRQRKQMQPVFHHRRIQGYAEVMSDYTTRTMAGWETGETLDLHAELMRLTMYIVGKTMFDADMDSLADEANAVAEAIASNQYWIEKEFWVGFPVPNWLPTKGNRTFKRNNETLKRILRPIIEARRGESEPKGDLLEMLMAARDEDGRPMSDEQLLDETINLFSAGHETTSNALTFAFYLLATHPPILAKLQAELDEVLNGRLPTTDDLPHLPYTEMVIKEAMRIYPPVWALQFRQVRETTTVGGYELKKGTVMTTPIFGLHRNERFYPNPETFDPERFSPERSADLPRYAYLPFGAGPHVCIGAQFAMMEAQLILALIAQQFTFSLAEDYVFELEPLVTMSPKHGLKVVVEKRERGEKRPFVPIQVPADMEEGILVCPFSGARL